MSASTIRPASGDPIPVASPRSPRLPAPAPDPLPPEDRPGIRTPPFYSIRTHDVEPVSLDLHRSLHPHRGRRHRGGYPCPRPGRGPGDAPAVRQARHPAEARAAALRGHQAHQGRADDRRQEARDPRDRDPHPHAPAPVPQPARARLRVEAQGLARDHRPQQDPLHVQHQRRQAVDRPGQGLRDRRHAATRHRVFRLARPRHALHPRQPGLPREAALHLDPGRGRGHAPLAPLLRLPQRPRHDRDDRHGRAGRCRCSRTGSWSARGPAPATP